MLYYVAPSALSQQFAKYQYINYHFNAPLLETHCSAIGIKKQKAGLIKVLPSLYIIDVFYSS